jgi:hypothetical protein
VTIGLYRVIQSDYRSIQGDLGENVNNLGAVIIGNGNKKIHMNMCLILRGYRDEVV